MKVVETKKYLAEALGTFFIVFFGLCAMLLSQTIFLVGAAFGVLVALTYILFNRYSGAHMNPAVSVAMYVRGKMAVKDLFYYMAAQLVGAFTGAGLAKIIEGILNVEFIMPNGYDLGSMTKAGVLVALIIEVALAFLFILVFLTASDRLKESKAASVIGTAFGIAMIIATPFTYGGLNPAKSLALAVFGGTEALGQVWLFVLAPVVGAVAAVFVYGFFADTDNEKSKVIEGKAEETPNDGTEE